MSGLKGIWLSKRDGSDSAQNRLELALLTERERLTKNERVGKSLHEHGLSL
jgi:hypothetical protein